MKNYAITVFMGLTLVCVLSNHFSILTSAIIALIVQIFYIIGVEIEKDKN